MLDRDKIPWYEAFAFGRAPFNVEFRIINVIYTQCMVEYKRFYDAMKKGKRVAKYRIFTVFFDNNKLDRRDMLALKTLSSTNANRLDDYGDVLSLTVYFERGLAMHTLGSIFTFKYLVHGSYEGRLSILDKIYRKAGIYMELHFDTIDYNPFYSIVNRALHIVAREVPTIKISTYQTDSTLIIRSCSRKRFRNYYNKKLPVSCVDWARYTLEDIMAFADWQPKRYIKCNPRLIKYYRC